MEFTSVFYIFNGGYFQWWLWTSAVACDAESRCSLPDLNLDGYLPDLYRSLGSFVLSW